MRSKTFISSMVGVAAAAAVAGSANAAAVSVYNFALTFNTPNPTSDTDFQSSSGSATGLWDSYVAAAVAEGSDVIASPGSMQFAVGSDFAASAGFELRSVAGANLVGVTDFQFNVTAYTGGATYWIVTATDIIGRQLASSVSISGTGQKTFAVSTFSNPIPITYGFDWSKVTTISLFAINDGSASSFTFDSWTAVGVVPAPGALALLGVAGVVGARRRRA